MTFKTENSRENQQTKVTSLKISITDKFLARLNKK